MPAYFTLKARRNQIDCIESSPDVSIRHIALRVGDQVERRKLLLLR